jgi:Domain of unknown function (DUF4268)
LLELGRLTPLNAREVWPHEAHDFTPWLLDNATHLAEVLGIDLELQAAEHPVGGYWLDLIGKDQTNDCVLIVENQLTSTDHAHLGQLLTYAAGTEAATIVWMATDFREEHRQALDWLNDLARGDVRFFGIEIAAVKIDDSLPAPLFRIRAQPNEWHAVISAAARASSEGGKANAYRAFWTRFLERVHAEHPSWTNAKVASGDNWMNLKCPIKGCIYGVNFAMGGKTRAELYIDTGDGEENLARLEVFAEHKTEIETAFGAPLSWEELPGRRACRIAVYGSGDAADSEQHDAYIDWMLDASSRLRAALEPFV